jgi:hypothetical protein
MSLNELIAQSGKFQAPDMIGQYAAAQDIQRGMQQNALNQMTMDEKRRSLSDQEGLRNYLRTNPNLADPTVQTQMFAHGKSGQEAVTSFAKAQQDAASARSGNATADKTEFEQFTRGARTVNSTEGVAQYVAAMYSHPRFGPLAKSIKPFAQSLKENLELFDKDPLTWQVSASSVPFDKVMELSKGTRQNVDTGGAIQGQTTNYRGEVVPGSVTSTPKTMTPGAAETTDIARKNVGLRERELEFNQDPVRQAAMAAAKATATAEKPMTPLQQQALRKTMVADQDSVKAATSTANELEKVADELLGNPEKKMPAHPGLGGITGYAAMVPSLPSGDAAKAQQKLETFKGKIAALGRSLASQNGKLGNMAVQEWKVVADAVENINPSAGNLEEQMRNVVRQAREFADRHKEKYDLTYENADALLGKKPAVATASPQGTPANPTPINAWADWAKNTGRK